MKKSSKTKNSRWDDLKGYGCSEYNKKKVKSKGKQGKGPPMSAAYSCSRIKPNLRMVDSHWIRAEIRCFGGFYDT